MIILDLDVNKLAGLELESDAPRQFDREAPIVLPIPLQLMQPNVRWLSFDLQVVHICRAVHDSQ